MEYIRTQWEDVLRLATDTEPIRSEWQKLTPDELITMRQAFLRAVEEMTDEPAKPEREEFATANAELQRLLTAWLTETSEDYRAILQAEQAGVERQREEMVRVEEFRLHKENVRLRETTQLFSKEPTAVEPSRQDRGIVKFGFLRGRGTQAREPSTLEKLDYDYQRMLEDLSRLRRNLADVAVGRLRYELTMLQRENSLPEEVRNAYDRVRSTKQAYDQARMERRAIPLLQSQIQALRDGASSADVAVDLVDALPPEESALMDADLARAASAAGPGNRRSVFLVHGRDEALAEAMRAFLRSMQIQVVEWDQAVEQTGQASPYVGDVVLAALKLADGVIVLLTPAEIVRLRDDLVSEAREAVPYGQARPNVIYEAGIADALAAPRTIYVKVGPVELFSDIGGRHVVRFDGRPESRNRLAGRLRAIGLEPNTSGADWHTSGDFEDAIAALNRAMDAELPRDRI